MISAGFNLRLCRAGIMPARVPADVRLAKAELELANTIGKEFVIYNLIMEIKEKFDFVLLDAPPSLSHLTVNALAAADIIVVPLLCEYAAYVGLEDLRNTMDSVDRIKRKVTPSIVIPTMYDFRTKHSKEVIQQAKNDEVFPIFHTPINKTVKLADCSLEAMDIIEFLENHKNEDTVKPLEKCLDTFKDLTNTILKTLGVNA
jgi:chromosome partitioning protein